MRFCSLLVFSISCTPTVDSSNLPLWAIQAVGSHNSYHVQTHDLKELAYGFDNLAVQLQQGVRQFELDVNPKEDGTLAVTHIELLDEGTNCATLPICLTTLASWSFKHPDHDPIVVLIEIKPEYSTEDSPGILNAIDDALLHSWGDNLLRAQDHPDGWPPLAAARGRLIAVLHTGGPWHTAYKEGLMWPDGRGTLTDGVFFHSVNDPFDPALVVAVNAHHLVRTRADASTYEAEDNDTTRRDQAFAAGAHFVSTDFIKPHPVTQYVVAPAGIWCNPVTAPASCEAELGPSPDY